MDPIWIALLPGSIIPLGLLVWLFSILRDIVIEIRKLLVEVKKK